MDKMMSKIVMRDHDISVPNGFLIEKNYSYETVIQKIKKEFASLISTEHNIFSFMPQPGI